MCSLGGSPKIAKQSSFDQFCDYALTYDYGVNRRSGIYSP